MADNLNEDQRNLLNRIMDGAALSELRQTERDLNDMDQQIRYSELDAAKLTDTDKKTQALLLAAQARKSLAESRNAFQAAKSKYNETVNQLSVWIRTASSTTGIDLGVPGLAGTDMSGLGLAPIYIAGIAIAGGVALAILLNALSNLLLSLQGKVNNTKGILENLSDLTQGTSNLINSLLIAGGIGLGVYLFFRFKKGNLKELFKSNKAESKTPLVVTANPYYLKKGGGAYYRNDIQPKWHESDAGPFDSILQAEDSGSDDFWFNNGRKLKGRPVQSKRAIAAYKKGLCSTNKISNYF